MPPGCRRILVAQHIPEVNVEVNDGVNLYVAVKLKVRVAVEVIANVPTPDRQGPMSPD